MKVEEKITAPGWIRVSLGDVTERSVSQDGPREGHDFIYVDIGSIARESKRIVDAKSLPDTCAPSRAKQVLKAGDVLVSMTRPNLNAVALVPPELDGAIGTTGFQVLRAAGVVPSILYYAVQTNEFIDAMCRLVQGALYPAVRPKDISSFQLALPSSLSQQHRIVAKIEELFSDLDAGVEALKKTRVLLKRYRQSVLKAAFEGRLTAAWREANKGKLEPAAVLLERIREERKKAEGRKLKDLPPVDTTDLPALPEGWEWARTEDVLSCPLINGRSAKTLAGGFPVLRLTAIRNGWIEMDASKEAALTAKQAEACLVSEGDFFVARGNGSLDLVGRGGFVRKADRRVAFPDTMIRMRFLTNCVDPRWMRCLWDSPTVRRQIERTARTTAGIYKVNQHDLESVTIPMASLDEQECIVEEIERRFTIADQVEKTVEASLRQSQRLRQAILKRAFSGRLVPQDPNDEPAEKLLERIRAERARVDIGGGAPQRGRRGTR